MKKQSAYLQQQLRENNKSVLEQVYLENKLPFINYAKRFNLSNEELLDVYQDSIIAMHQNFVVKQVVLKQSTVKTYLFGIAKHKIYDILKNKSSLINTNSFDDGIEEIDIETETLTLQQEQLKKYFKHLGESCKEVLKLYYYRNLTIKEIVEKTHYKDENTVKSHKSRCLKKLIALIKN